MKEPMPTQVTMIPFRKQLIIFLIGCLGFQVIGLITSLPFSLYGSTHFATTKEIEAFVNQAKIQAFINCITYCLTYIALILSSGKYLPEIIQKFKIKDAYVGAFVGVAAIYVFNILYGVILSLFNANVTDNQNEAALESIIASYPVMSLFIFGLLGPICEELTYRLGLFSLCKRKNRILAYTLTIIVFTLIHANFTANSWLNELLNIPYYAVAAGIFCFLYDRYGFASSTTAHVLNNLISIVTTIIYSR